MIYEHPSGGKLYQSGINEVPEDPADLGVSLIVAATSKYRPNEKHTNYSHIPFKDEVGMPDWKWKQIEDMVVPAVKLMVSTLRAGKGVLSVCRAGINRSSLLTGLTLRETTDLRPQEIVDLIRSRRSYECLFNEDFRDTVLHGF
jgi:protein-tyrosine phosphatase